MDVYILKKLIKLSDTLRFFIVLRFKNIKQPIYFQRFFHSDKLELILKFNNKIHTYRASCYDGLGIRNTNRYKEKPSKKLNFSSKNKNKKLPCCRWSSCNPYCKQ